jgi:di/tricarboxylate transporter
MTGEIIILFIIIISAIILFVTEKIPVDLTALSVMGMLLLTGIITPEQGLAGFSNPATITIGAMFILSASLERTGVINFLGLISTKLFKRNFWFALIVTMVMVGFISAFINNTPVVAVFIPILLMVSRENNISVSKLLIPLSFASIFGGICTLIGTSTNILVNSIAVQYGEAPFTMFEFTRLGIIFFAIGLVYMLLIGVKLIPSRRKEDDLTKNFKINNYLTEIVILPEAKSVGHPLLDSPLMKEVNIQILNVIRDGKRMFRPLSTIIVEPNDVLRVMCDVEKIQKLKDRVGIKLKSDIKLGEQDFMKEDIILVEAIVAPNASIIGRSLKALDFRNKFRGTALAIRHHERLILDAYANTPLDAGDALLIAINKDNLSLLKNNENFVIVTDVPLQKFRKSKIIPAILIIAGVVLTASFNIMPIVESAALGSILMVLFGIIKLEEAYRAIDWRVIFMLAGILSVGVALDRTGAARLISNFMVSNIGFLGPIFIISVFYLLTSVLTEVMSNNATAVILTPIAITIANELGVDPRPFIISIMFAASASFMTPVGYQTNTMIYSVGQYKFVDFLKVGTPLNIIFWLAASLLVPYFFPL